MSISGYLAKKVESLAEDAVKQVMEQLLLGLRLPILLLDWRWFAMRNVRLQSCIYAHSCVVPDGHIVLPFPSSNAWPFCSSTLL